jgi:hypothetical protein
VSWESASPLSGRVVNDTVRIDAPGAGGTFPLIALAPANVDPAGYAMEGSIRYQDVEGDGYLEMWSVFPDGGRYFSRTLEPAGARGVIAGSSDWRAFQLPFASNGGPGPTRVDLNLVLPGAGMVEIGPIRLVAAGAGAAWWSDRTAGAIGAGAGAMIGLLGATLGVLVARRKGRRLVLAVMALLSFAGLMMLAVAGAATIEHQPYAVVFPLLLLGAILASVFGGGYRATKRGYEETELRRMHALDTENG